MGKPPQNWRYSPTTQFGTESQRPVTRLRHEIRNVLGLGTGQRWLLAPRARRREPGPGQPSGNVLQPVIGCRNDELRVHPWADDGLMTD